MTSRRLRPPRAAVPRPAAASTGVQTYPLASPQEQGHAVATSAGRTRGAAPFAVFLDGLPRDPRRRDACARLVADVLRARGARQADRLGPRARTSSRSGLSPVLIDLMERGLVTGLALNGAGIVHDFELAVAGQTSEDVDGGLGSGAFGMARETGEEINRAIRAGDRGGPRPRRGARPLPRERAARAPRGEPAGRGLAPRPARHRARGRRHRHRAHAPGLRSRPRSAAPPTSTSGSSPAQVARLGGGGVYLNVGSAVLLPEVFLKAVTLARNLGHELADFATANLDFIQSYRPEHQRGAAPDAGRGPRLQPHRPPRDPGPAAGGGARRRSVTSDVRMRGDPARPAPRVLRGVHRARDPERGPPRIRGGGSSASRKAGNRGPCSSSSARSSPWPRFVNFVRRGRSRATLEADTHGVTITRRGGYRRASRLRRRRIPLALDAKERLSNGEHAGWTRKLAVRGRFGSFAVVAFWAWTGRTRWAPFSTPCSRPGLMRSKTGSSAGGRSRAAAGRSATPASGPRG